MNATAMVAEHLDSHSEALIESWRSKILRHRDVPQSASLTYSDFLDHVPILIERMADRLRGRSVDIADAAEKHGRARFRQGYDMVEMVTELGHLRTALVESTFAYARENDFDLPSLEAAHSAIHEILNEATVESFRQFQEDSQAAAEGSRQELELRNRAIEDARLMAENERAKLGILLANLPVGVWVFDAEGKVIGLNSRAEILQDLPASHTTGRQELMELARLHWLGRASGTEAGSQILPVAQALAGEVVSQQEMFWPDHNQVKVVSASAAPLRDAAGNVFGAVVVAQDVSANRQLQADLAKTSSQLRAIVEQSPVMIWRNRAGWPRRFRQRNLPRIPRPRGASQLVLRHLPRRRHRDPCRPPRLLRAESRFPEKLPRPHAPIARSLDRLDRRSLPRRQRPVPGLPGLVPGRDRPDRAGSRPGTAKTDRRGSLATQIPPDAGLVPRRQNSAQCGGSLGAAPGNARFEQRGRRGGRG